MVENNEEVDIKTKNRLWNHRRRGYYLGVVWALLSTIAFIALEIAYPGLIERIAVVVGWSYGVSTTLILAYYGNTAVEEFSRNKLP